MKLGVSVYQGIEQDVTEFHKILSAFNSYIADSGRLHLLSPHVHAEVIYMHLLNSLYGWSLENANGLGKGAEAIDLIDRKNGIVVQVTATCTKEKIRHTLQSPALDEYSSRDFRLKFVFIGDQHDAQRMKGKGSPVDEDDNTHNIAFDYRTDILFTADIVSRFESLESASRRRRCLDRIREDVGELVFSKHTTDDTDDATPSGSVEYDINLICALGCFSRQYSDQAQPFVFTKPYAVDWNSNNEDDLTANPITKRMYNLYRDNYLRTFERTNPEAESSSGVREPHLFWRPDGGRFSVVSQPQYHSIAFLLSEHYDMYTLARHHELEKLDSSISDDESKTTFYVDEFKDGQKLLILTADLKAKRCYINVGIMGIDVLRISIKPYIIDFSNVYLASTASIDGVSEGKDATVSQIGLNETDARGSVVYSEYSMGAAPTVICLNDTSVVARDISYDDDGNPTIEFGFEYGKCYLIMQLRYKDKSSGEQYTFLPASNYQIGMCYLKGTDGFPRSLIAAASHFECEASPEGYYAVARVFSDEEEFVDEEEAIKYLYKSAVKGFLEAQHEIALRMMLLPDSDSETIDNVAEWLASGIDKGNDVSKLLLAFAFEKGKLGQVDLQNAWNLYNRCSKPFEPAHYRLEMWPHNDDRELEIDDEGYAEYCIGGPLLHGSYGFSNNTVLAIKYLTIAAEKGCFDARYELFTLYSEESEGWFDRVKATNMCLLCAEEDTSVSIRLSNWLIDGKSSLSEDDALNHAARILGRLVDAGNVTAMNNLGWLLSGNATDDFVDYPRAFELLQNAVEQGCVNAARHLGRMYELGLYADADLSKAIELYRRAADGGNVSAIERLLDFETEYQ